MISREDIQRLIHREETETPVLSAFLDMSVDSDNKRTHDVFLNQRRREFRELDSDRANHHPEALGTAFGRLERWLEDEFDHSSRGVALYTEIGGDWFEALQLPVPIGNRLTIATQPAVAPLAEVVERYHHHGIILIDREHMRMLSVYMGQPLEERAVEAEPYPAPHDVQRGGYSAHDFQKRKREEVRHFFKEFALEVEEFDRRYQPDDVILLGTDENTKKFLDFLPAQVQDKVVHRAHADVDATSARVLERLAPYFDEQLEREQAGAVELLHDRVDHEHLAVSGFDDTLEQLQEGKIETLILVRGVERLGARCTRCGFYLDRRGGGEPCPYCGGETRDGVDLGEAMVRIAEEQDLAVEFVDADALSDLGGVGGLLKF